MVKMSPDDVVRLDKTIKFYEWALANHAEFIRTERKPRTKINLRKRLIALQDEARQVR